MTILAEGLMYSEELNKFIYSNDYVLNSGLSLDQVSKTLGVFAEYISDDEYDLLYARSTNIKIFNDVSNEFDYSLLYDVDLDYEIMMLKEKKCNCLRSIDDEYKYIRRHEHNVLLLKIAFILKNHLDKSSNGVYLMRGSGVASYILYVIGLNKVNPQKFGLDYKDFWDY
jgi:hypothetical protein